MLAFFPNANSPGRWLPPAALRDVIHHGQVDQPGWTTQTLTIVTCIATLYTVIRTFRHRGIEKFFRTGSKAGIQPKHANKLRVQLFALDNAKGPGDMNAPGWRLHPLAGTLKDHWSVSVSGNWRLTFGFEGEDAILVDYQDYH